VNSEAPTTQNLAIVNELAKLIKLNGEGKETSVSTLRSACGTNGLSFYLSWDSNGQLKIE